MKTSIKDQLAFYKIFYRNSLNFKQKSFLFLYVISRTFLQIIDLFGIGLLVYSINDLLLENKIYNYYVDYFLDPIELTDFYINYFCFLLLAFGFKYLFQAILNYNEKSFFSDVLIDLQEKAIKSIINQNYISTKDKKFTQISDSFILNLKTFVDNYFKTLTDSFSDIAFILASIFIFIAYNYKVTLVLFLFNIVVIYPLVKFIKNSNIKNGVIFTEYQPKIFSVFSDFYNNVEFLKLYGYVRVFKSRLLDFLKISIRADQKRKFLNDLIKPIVEFVLFMVIIISILLLINYDPNFRNSITDLIVIIVASIRVLPFLLKLSQTISSLSYYSVNAKSTFDILNIHTNFLESKENLKDFKSIRFENIHYQINKLNIFNDFNYNINKFDKIFIEGPTGSGKSTFLKILIGIIDPVKGKIVINNMSKKNYKFNNLGYVDQNPIIFNDNIIFNITFNDNFNLVDLNKYNKIIEICELKELTQKTDENIQLNFDKFSGGEKQRIALARALYNCENLLVLDESTSAIDLKTSRKIINGIISNFEHLTILMVSHQDSLKDLFSKKLIIKNK